MKPSVPKPFRGKKKKNGNQHSASGIRVPAEQAIESCRVFIDGEALPGNFAPQAAREKIEEYGRGFVWVSMHAPLEVQMTKIALQFGIHELIVEDAVQAHQRPKVERYEDQIFVVARSVRYRDHDEVTDTRQIISTGEIQMVVGANFIITVRHGAEIPNFDDQLVGDEELITAGPIAICWKILDVTVDAYATITDELSEEVDSIEEEVFTPSAQFNIDRIYSYKREILEMKHAINPLAPALKSLFSENKDVIPKKIRSYLRDVYDNELVIRDHVAGFDERLTSLLDASVAKVSIQQNRDMRTISAVVGMAAGPTMIAGIYGMNFDFMPELHLHYGYFFALAAMVIVVAAMFWWFRRNDWL